MKEELQGKLVEILTSIQTAAGKASDFAMEQLPDIAQSYVLYGRFWETSTALIYLAAAVVSAYLSFRADKFYRATDDTYPGGLLAGFGGLFSLVMLLVMSAYAKAAALVWFAPKVWLLKEIAGLLK